MNNEYILCSKMLMSFIFVDSMLDYEHLYNVDSTKIDDQSEDI